MNNNPLRIAFLTYAPAHDKRYYSGSLYYMGKALERYCGEVIYVDRIISWERYFARLLHEVSMRLLHKRIDYNRLLFMARKKAQVAARLLAGQHIDVIVAPDCIAETAFLQTDIPILLPLDVTFRLQRNYYPHASNLLEWSARQTEIVERAAFQNVTRLLFSSPWAARSALEDYGIAPHKVNVIFFGANLDHIPSCEQVHQKRLTNRCHLLFIGTDWKRKGGDIAYETLLKLEEMGLQVELIVCGTTPPSSVTHSHMTVIPYLDKNDEQQSREIEQLYTTADFLILPTRADCAPNVFKEANAFGVPVITTDTGGVADVIKDGENGYTLPYNAHSEEYARLIAEIYRDEARYNKLATSSRAAYDQRLSWDAWAQAVGDIMKELINNSSREEREHASTVLCCNN